ncbi:MAG TPA: hypothetical protein VMD47_11605 [Candidatus Acidoferrales bacterium]|nr:hypothetical protein [Candidatus Acidoferrales bacterium]
MSPRAATTAPKPWPAAVSAANEAPPRILALWMNETTLVPGSQWRGRIATTTNVASVEIRTESFSFNATRVAYGQFVFEQHLLDIVPQYKRGYTLNVIARNSAGLEDARLIPILLR